MISFRSEDGGSDGGSEGGGSAEYLELLYQCLILGDMERGYSPKHGALYEGELIKDVRILWDELSETVSCEYLGIEGSRSIVLSLANTALLLYQYKTELSAEQVYNVMATLHVFKNRGYSGQNKDVWRNFRECNRFDVSTAYGILVRICDKYMRMMNVYETPENDRVGERFLDTLMDFASYCLILICILDEDSANANIVSKGDVSG